MPLKVFFRPQAEEDLQAIYLHIATDSPDRALEYVRRLCQRCEALADYPNRGRPRDDLIPGLRMLAFERSAVIAYRVEEDKVRIVDIFYRGRDYEVLLRGGLGEDELRAFAHSIVGLFPWVWLRRVPGAITAHGPASRGAVRAPSA